MLLCISSLIISMQDNNQAVSGESASLEQRIAEQHFQTFRKKYQEFLLLYASYTDSFHGTTYNPFNTLMTCMELVRLLAENNIYARLALAKSSYLSPQQKSFLQNTLQQIAPFKEQLEAHYPSLTQLLAQ